MVQQQHFWRRGDVLSSINLEFLQNDQKQEMENKNGNTIIHAGT